MDIKDFYKNKEDSEKVDLTSLVSMTNEHIDSTKCKEDKRFQPWCIKLEVITGRDHPPFTWDLYCRGYLKSLEIAAFKIFVSVEKTSQGIDHLKYPTVSGKAMVYKLTEEQYADVWKFARKQDKVMFGGPRELPSLFHYEEENWIGRKLIRACIDNVLTI